MKYLKKALGLSIVVLLIISAVNLPAIGVLLENNEPNYPTSSLETNEFVVGEMIVKGEPHQYVSGEAIYRCIAYDIPDEVYVGFKDKVTLIVKYNLNPKGSNDKAICKIICDGETAKFKTPDDTNKHVGELRLDVNIVEGQSYTINLTLEWWDCWYENILCPKRLVGAVRKTKRINMKTVDVQHDVWVGDFFVSLKDEDWDKEEATTSLRKDDNYYVHIVYCRMWPKNYRNDIQVDWHVSKPGFCPGVLPFWHLNTRGENKIQTDKVCFGPFIVDWTTYDYEAKVHVYQCNEQDKDENKDNNKDSFIITIKKPKDKCLNFPVIFEKSLFLNRIINVLMSNSYKW
jgi:hypothetical protein